MTPEPQNPAAPSPEPQRDAFYEAVRTLIRAGPQFEWAQLVAIIVLVYLTSPNATGMAAFAAVLAIRDLSLLAVMRATDTFDARLLFIPFGKGELRVGISPGREAVAVLGGPAILVVLSLVTFVTSRIVGPGIVKDMAFGALGLAAFTLLPLKPYDGFRLINLALFSRSARLEVIVSIFTSLVLAAIAVATQLWFLVFVALVNIGVSRRVLKVEKGADLFRQSGFASVPVTAELPEEGVRALYTATLAAFPDTMAQKQPAHARFCAVLMREVHQRAGRVSPSVGVSILLLTVYAALIVYFIVGFLIAIGLTKSAGGVAT